MEKSNLLLLCGGAVYLGVSKTGALYDGVDDSQVK